MDSYLSEVTITLALRNCPMYGVIKPVDLIIVHFSLFVNVLLILSYLAVIDVYSVILGLRYLYISIEETSMAIPSIIMLSLMCIEFVFYHYRPEGPIHFYGEDQHIYSTNHYAIIDVYYVSIVLLQA